MQETQGPIEMLVEGSEPVICDLDIEDDRYCNITDHCRGAGGCGSAGW